MKRNKGCFPENNYSFAQNSNPSADVKFDAVFTLIPKSTPQIIRKCTRCGENRYTSSDKFRINANKKIIDVWLIFKCIVCENTLKISIISRKSVADIDQALLDRFHENDMELAWQYTFDPSYIENGMVVDWAIEFEVEPRSIMICKNEINKRDEHDEAIFFLIQSRFFLKMPTSTILRKILNISRTQLEKMQAKGDIEIWTSQGKSMTLKNSMGFGCTIRLISWKLS